MGMLGRDLALILWMRGTLTQMFTLLTRDVPTSSQPSSAARTPKWISKEEVRVHLGVAEEVASVLSRVLLSVDKTLRCAGSLGIGPLDDPDIQYLSHVRKAVETQF